MRTEDGKVVGMGGGKRKKHGKRRDGGERAKPPPRWLSCLLAAALAGLLFLVLHSLESFKESVRNAAAAQAK